MSEYYGLLAPGAWVAAFVLVVALGGFLLWRLIECPTNNLKWTDLVATNEVLNAYKIGYWIATVISSWAIIKQTYMGTLDASLLGVYLAFLGGVPVSMSAIGKGRSPSKSEPDDDDLPPVPPPRNRHGDTK